MSYPGDPAGQQPAYPAYPDPNQGGYQPPQQPSPFGQPQPQSAPPAPGQPYSSPPAQAQPYSSPPAGQQYSSPPAPAGYGPDQTAPYSGAGGYGGYDPNAAGLPPTSGAYGGPPTSGPGPLGGPTAPGQPKNKLVPIFASLMVVFLLATAVVSVLYFTKNSEYNDAKKAANTKETQLSADLKKSQEEAKKAQDELATAKRDLGGSQAQADELARQKAVISKCFRLLIEASQAISAGNQALADQKRAEYTPVCNEADKYLDD